MCVLGVSECKAYNTSNGNYEIMSTFILLAIIHLNLNFYMDMK